MFPCEIYQFYESATVADPDLQIRGGGGGVGGGHPDSEIRGGGLKKFFFRLFIASFWSKNKGGPGPPGSHPWICHCGNY